MRRGRPPYPDLLTPREQEVLGLLRERLTNRQIAERLQISESGVRYHVSEILSKLGVASREEAASWRPERAARGHALVAGLSAAVRGVRLVAVATPLALALIVALTVGYAVMSSRSDGDREQRSPGEDQEASIQALLDVAAEATLEARVVLPGAELVFVAYATPNGSYTFRFSQPRSQAEVSILGPNEPRSGPGRWERIQEERPRESPALPLLDLSRLNNGFEAVADAAAAKSTSTTANMGIVLSSDGQALKWQVMNRPAGILLINCQTPDSDLSLMTCEPATPAPGNPTLAPTP